ncbi:MAG TPA: DNA polymerase III subunit delta, partial [Kofleriaceae bacterium]|nr:DNA polymerase III subunit delta [Kofleriaceae bacterium]
MDDLVASARAGRLDPVYVLSSDHPVLIERAVAAIRDAAVPPAARGFNYDVVEGKASGQRIAALAQTLPMMAQRRMIFVRELGSMNADDAEPLLSYLASPNPSTVLVAVSSKVDKRQKLYAAVAKKGWLHTLAAPRQLAPWVQHEAAAAKVSIAPAAVTRLLDVVGADLSRLTLAVAQLGLYAGDRAVTADDVDDLIADTRERTVFELTDAIGAGDLEDALAAVAKLCDQRESAVGVVVMLARHLRQVAAVHSALAAGVPRGQWGERLGVPPFLVDKLAQHARFLAPAVVHRATANLAAADRALKGDPTLTGGYTGPQLKVLGRELGERVVLERLVTSVVEAAREAA